MKIIMHLDIDSYFPSAERTIDPSLIGKSIIISTGGRRSIVTATSYEAKAKGIKTGSPLYLAKQLDPKVIQIKPHFSLYVNLSSKVFEYIAKHYSPKIEVASIDECYIDVTNLINKNMPARKLAQQIQNNIWKKFKLPVSIGISTNKFVAKMSTQINKPLGITLTKPEDFLKVAGDWDIQEFNGVGKGMTPKLRAIGINTIKDLAEAPSAKLKSVIGSMAEEYQQKAKGSFEAKVDPGRNELKSVGNSVTFQDRDRNGKSEIYSILSNLTHMVALRAINRNLVGKVVTVFFNDAKPKYVSTRTRKQTTLKIPIQSYEEIYEVGQRLFSSIWKGETIKQIGITLSQLSPVFDTTFQTSLFEDTREMSQVEEIISKVNSKLRSKDTYIASEEILKVNKERFQTKYLESDKILKYYDKKR